MKKIQRQEKLSVIQPPSVGPMIGADHDAHAVDRHRHAVLSPRESFRPGSPARSAEAAAAEP